MPSSTGIIFRVTGLLCGKFTGHRWSPLTEAIDAELWCFLWSAQWWGWWFETPSRSLLRRCNANFLNNTHTYLHSSIIAHLHVFWQAGLVSLKWKKNQQRALRFVLMDPVSDYKSLLSKSSVDSFRISSIKYGGWKLLYFQWYWLG